MRVEMPLKLPLPWNETVLKHAQWGRRYTTDTETRGGKRGEGRIDRPVAQRKPEGLWSTSFLFEYLNIIWISNGGNFLCSSPLAGLANRGCFCGSQSYHSECKFHFYMASLTMNSNLPFDQFPLPLSWSFSSAKHHNFFPVIAASNYLLSLRWCKQAQSTIHCVYFLLCWSGRYIAHIPQFHLQSIG